MDGGMGACVCMCVGYIIGWIESGFERRLVAFGVGSESCMVFEEGGFFAFSLQGFFYPATGQAGRLLIYLPT